MQKPTPEMVVVWIRVAVFQVVGNGETLDILKIHSQEYFLLDLQRKDKGQR